MRVLLHVRGLRNLLHNGIGNVNLLTRISRGRAAATARAQAHAQKSTATKEIMAAAA